MAVLVGVENLKEAQAQGGEGLTLSVELKTNKARATLGAQFSPSVVFSKAVPESK